jgi:hypothetical protein
MLIFFQDAAASKSAHWWEIITGVLAIPAAIIGLKYSYHLTEKTRLEITKTELEIEEKRRLLGQPAVSTSPVAGATSGMGSKITDFLILRFLILYLFTRLWGLAEDVLRTALHGIGFVLVQGMHLEQRLDALDNNMAAIYGAFIAGRLTDLLYWIFTFSLTWPLFKDVNHALGLRLSNYLPWKKRTP